MKKSLTFNIVILTVCIIASSCNNVLQNSYRLSKRDAVLKNIIPPTLPENTLSILSFGAVGDSITDCKPAFDKAMIECTRSKGAKIVVPPGIYYIAGPIHLVSNVCLEIQKGARLKFSSDPEHYLPVVLTSWEGTFVYNYSPFIYGYQLKNVSIIGNGTIDGNASQTFNTWKQKQDSDQLLTREMNHKKVEISKRVFGAKHFLRPQLIQLFGCKNILIEDIHITNSPFWCIHLLKSENITIRGISYNAKNINNDGIDPEYSKNILIENVDFNNGDDNIAIKAGRDDEGRITAIPCENIVIRNCRFKGLHAVVIGSEMSAGVRSVFVENCVASGYCKRGIFLKSNPDRGGYITDIFINNVKFDEVEDCFYITSFYHGEGKGHNSHISYINVDSLSCRKATNAGLVIQGYPTKKVTNVYFSHVNIDTAKIAISFSNASNIIMSDVNIGGDVNVAPSSAK